MRVQAGVTPRYEDGTPLSWSTKGDELFDVQDEVDPPAWVGEQEGEWVIGRLRWADGDCRCWVPKAALREEDA
jgi:hypothetical protein